MIDQPCRLKSLTDRRVVDGLRTAGTYAAIPTPDVLATHIGVPLGRETDQDQCPAVEGQCWDPGAPHVRGQALHRVAR